VIGDIDDPGMEIEIAVRKYGVPHEFSDRALEQASKLPDEVRPVDIRHRVDLRDVPLVTIDGEDAARLRRRRVLRTNERRPRHGLPLIGRDCRRLALRAPERCAGC